MRKINSNSLKTLLLVQYFICRIFHFDPCCSGAEDCHSIDLSKIVQWSERRFGEADIKENKA